MNIKYNKKNCWLLPLPHEEKMNPENETFKCHKKCKGILYILRKTIICGDICML